MRKTKEIKGENGEKIVKVGTEQKYKVMLQYKNKTNTIKEMNNELKGDTQTISMVELNVSMNNVTFAGKLDKCNVKRND